MGDIVKHVEKGYQVRKTVLDTGKYSWNPRQFKILKLMADNYNLDQTLNNTNPQMEAPEGCPAQVYTIMKDVSIFI